ncbi:penicillin acylase family protein [Nocardioidaceae bacterium]|nr:penicillin acylase family protein [Nocardioidaceae bacterium]
MRTLRAARTSRTQSPGALTALTALLVAGGLAVPQHVTPAAATAPAAAAPAARGDDATREVLRPTTGRYRATIRLTRHGIPHITAQDYGSLGFGKGWMTTRQSGCNLIDTVLTGRGIRSKVLGPATRYADGVTLDASNLEVDTLAGDLRNRRVVEKLLRDPLTGPGPEVRAMVTGYVAGANRYLASIGGWRNYSDPTCNRLPGLPARVQPIDLYYGIYFANLLASAGVFVSEIAGASPPSPGDPGLPSVPLAADVDRDALLRALGRDPDRPFGSNATAVGSRDTSTGKGMLLGNPHFPWNGRYRFDQSHLRIPGEYEVSGGSLIGSPVVNIGWNRDVAWSHTVSTAYRFTPYEYRTVVPGGLTYLTADGPRQVQRREVEVTVRRPDGSLRTVVEDVYRTPEGYVIDAPEQLMAWSPVSFFAIRDANAEHLRTLDTFWAMGKSRSVRSLLRAQDRGAGMPWVNTIAADRRGHALYADHSVVPNVPDALVQRCLTPIGAVLLEVAGLPGLDGTRAASDCAWRTDADAQRPGIFGPTNLPQTITRDWVVNANDSHWLPNPDTRLEGFAEIIGCEQCERTVRTRMVYRYVTDRLAGRDSLARGRKVTPRTLRTTQHENRVFAAELARQGGDLATVCRLAAGGDACRTLAAWDGRSDRSSRGTALFEEFWRRAGGVTGLWQVPFSAADPVRTPRDLNETNPLVVQAMRDALAHLEEEGIAHDAPWGLVHRAGDLGAPPVRLGGGEGFSGNANALAATVVDGRYRVDYGSSHIQAVSFLPRGRVQARTILTYGQAIDPTSAYAADQTRLFGRERWVAFPTSEKQIGRQLVRVLRVGGPA